MILKPTTTNIVGLILTSDFILKQYEYQTNLLLINVSYLFLVTTQKQKIYKANSFIVFMATRYRKVNLYGNRYVIELMQVDIEDLNLNVGDMIDIEDAVRRTSIDQVSFNKLKVGKKK